MDNQQPKEKMTWFIKRKKKIYQIMLVIFILAFIMSIIVLFTQRGQYGGTREILIYFMPVIFGFYIFTYIKRLKQL